MIFDWQHPQTTASDASQVEHLARELHISQVLAGILLRRGLRDPSSIHAHLHPDMMALHDPLLLPGMAAAIRRIRRALEEQERILVHGDYDVDGVSATVLLLNFFRMLGAEVSHFIPDRLRDGYSFGPQSIHHAREIGAGLVISVDCGITSEDPIAELDAAGIDAIITDHHKAAQEIPRACAVVNPTLPGSTYPFQDLCGTAVALKLAWALAEDFTARQRSSDEVRAFLREAMAWVAIGTICDVMPLVGENRILVRYGLHAIRHSTNPGLRALLDTTGIGNRALSSRDVAFRIGPRINAAGRIAHASRAVELFSTSSFRDAQQLAAELEELNTERQRIDQDCTSQARRRALEELAPDAAAIVLADERWHPGIVGISASRLVDEFQLPAILIALRGSRGRGSGRSVPWIDLHHYLSRCREHLLRFGGHAYAAGLEIEASAVAALREHLNALLIEDGKLRREREICRIDAQISLAELTPPLIADLERLAPFGCENDPPRLLAEDLRPVGVPRLRGRHRQHLAFRVHQEGLTVDAILFGGAGRADELTGCERISIVFTPSLRRGNRGAGVQLEIHDFCARPQQPTTRPSR